MNSTLGLGDLCGRMGIPYRHARYVLERGVVPPGADLNPGKGEHRDFTGGQAFWLAVVLLAKSNGVRVPAAKQIAEFAEHVVQGAANSLNWDHGFAPFRGKFETKAKWFIEIGDMKYIRIVTTAYPSKPDETYELPWHLVGKRAEAGPVKPIVFLKIDLSELARRLGSR
jgi:hypothetical protein